MRIAWFITPHGFGHATRSLAVMQAIHDLRPETVFDIYSDIPPFLIEQSLSAPYRQVICRCDVGLVQHDAFSVDVPASIQALDQLYPFSDGLLDELAAGFHQAGTRLVVCDIAALGIAAAERAGLPSVLIENFTWDWIYGDYDHPRFRELSDYLAGWYDKATRHIQAGPPCLPRVGADLVDPIARRPRRSKEAVRRELGISLDRKLVLITMGGFGKQIDPGLLAEHHAVDFLLPGPRLHQGGNLVFLEHFSSFFHPDLIQACDGVVGKLGYSTFAETWLVGKPYGHILRQGFRESDTLAAYLKDAGGVAFDQETFDSGLWLTDLEKLLGQACREPTISGADAAASFVLAAAS